MRPDELREAARALIDDPPSDLVGVWPRAAALLARQAIEQEVNDDLARRSPGVERVSWRVKFAVLAELGGDPDLVARYEHAWAVLSRATHQHGYEVGPTADELRACM